ncbi:MAG: 2-C-methyl-D-erythritol 4-phosphate cytidylyltransferase [Desulfomonilia bacterium]
MSHSAVIVAGGSGSRFGEKKQFLDLKGTPVLKRAVDCFDSHESVHEIIVVVPEEDMQRAREILSGTRTPFTVVSGGARRRESVLNGLRAVTSGESVLIHDGVRPFVSHALISRVIDGLRDADACIPALPVTNTLKEALDGIVVTTVSRQHLYEVQTPQACVLNSIIHAHEISLRAGNTDVTDDSALIEAAGGRVRIVQGDPFNIKITHTRDLALAEVLAQCPIE